LQDNDNLDDFIGMNVSIPESLSFKKNVNTAGLVSGILLKDANGRFKLIPFGESEHVKSAE